MIVALILISMTGVFVLFKDNLFIGADENTEQDDEIELVDKGSTEQVNDYVRLHPELDESYREKMNELTNTEAVDFTMVDVDGQKTRFSDYTTENIIVAFVASWCGPCNYMLPVYSEFNSLEDTPELILVAPFDSGDDFKNLAIAAAPLGLTVYMPEDFAPDDYMINTVPQVTFIDKEGAIQIISGGQLELETLVDYANNSF